MEKQALIAAFVSLLRAAMTETPPPALDPMTDRQALCAMAKSHDLLHLIAPALSAQTPPCEPALAERLTAEQMLSLYRAETMQAERDRIGEVLAEAGIPYIPLKGAYLSAFYPKGVRRIGCDIDLLVKREDLAQALVCLRGQGYGGEKRQDHDIALTSPTGISLELHFSLCSGEDPTNAILARAWEFAVPDPDDPLPPSATRHRFTPDFLLFYQLAHMKKHFRGGGCGVRSFLDLYVLETRIGIDRHAADALLRESGSLAFAEGMFALVDRWLHAAPPTDLVDRLEELILRAGVYGALQNSVAFSQIRLGGRFRHFLRKVFLTYDQMLVFYPSLEKHRWLLPLYQVRRWCRILFCGGVGHAVREVRMNQRVSDAYREELLELYRRLKL